MLSESIRGLGLMKDEKEDLLRQAKYVERLILLARIDEHESNCPYRDSCGDLKKLKDQLLESLK